MTLYIHLATERMHQLAFGVENVGDPSGDESEQVRAHVEKLMRLLLWITQEGKGQVVLFFETTMFFRGVRTDTDDTDVLILELLEVVSESACLTSTSRGVVFRVKVDHEGFTEEALRAQVVPILIGKFK